MAFHTNFATDFNTFLDDFGNQVRFRYFTPTFNTGSYDDAVSLAQSGTDVWTSGIFLPFHGDQPGAEERVLEPGKLKTADGTLYVASGIQLSGMWKVGLGSPPSNEYAPLEEGVIAPEPGGIKIYQKVFLRRLTTGSLAEE